MWFSLFFLIKTNYVHAQVEVGNGINWWAFNGTIALVLTLSLCAVSLPQWVADLGLWLAGVAVSSIYLVDLLYYRGVADFPSVSLLVGIHQLPVIKGAIKASLLSSDVLLVLDLIPAFLLMFWHPNLSRPQKWRCRWLPLLPCLLTLVMLGYAIKTKDLMSSRNIGPRISNKSQVKSRGLPLYHLYDIYHYRLPRNHKYEPAPEEIIQRRLALSRASVGPGFPGYASQKGRSVMIIKLESFSSFLIDLKVHGQEVTPFLNQLKNDSIWGQGEDQAYDGGSSDCEFIVLNSLHPASFGPLVYHFAKNRFRGLPHIVAELGYRTWKAVPFDGSFWNNRVSGYSYGFQEGLYEEAFHPDPDNTRGWGLTDKGLFMQLLPMMRQSKKPYLSYVATLAMHHPFASVEPRKKLLRFPEKLDKSMMGRYLQLARLRDEHIRFLCEEMKKDGSWDDTILALVGDHRTRMLSGEYQRVGLDVPSHKRDRVLILIHCPGDQPRLAASRGIGLIDVGPTLLHLLGIEPTKAAFLGKNLLAGPKSAVTRRGYVTAATKILHLGSKLELSQTFDLAQDKLVEVEPDSELYRQGLEELQISDTLIIGDRVLDFAGEL